MILISNDFWHKIKMYNFDPYNVLLAIATNIPVLLMTDFVLQSHIYSFNNLSNSKRILELTILYTIMIPTRGMKPLEYFQNDFLPDNER